MAKPKIRFKGYQDDWEQRKLEDLCELITKQTGFDYAASIKPALITDRKDDTYSFIQNKDFCGNDINMNTDFYIPVEVAERFPKILLDKPSVLISISGRIGNVGFYKLQEKAFIGGAVGICKLRDAEEGEFIIQELESEYGQKYFKSLIKASSHANITVEDIRNIELQFPKEEQEKRKISDIMSNLDHLITLHQRKHLGWLKVGKNAWEQRKAIDIADYSKGNGYSKGDLTDAGTPIILYGRLYTKYQFAISEVDTFAVPRNGAVYSQGNEVIVPASGETAEDIARASAVEKSGVLLGGDLNILRPFDFINPLFLALAISNGEPQKELAKKAQGKSVVHIHNTDIQEVTIAYPSRTEQDRIVSVFCNLDHLITLHQQK